MNQKICILVLYAVVAAAALKNLNPPINTGNQTKKLDRLGTVGNKTYYVERNGQGNWTDAQVYCERNGLKLATIKTPQESVFLRNGFDDDYIFLGWHWIDGRDSQTLKQLAWNENSDDVTVDIPVLFDTGFSSIEKGDFQTCASYYIDGAQSGIVLQKCSEYGGFYLCESEE